MVIYEDKRVARIRRFLPPIPPLHVSFSFFFSSPAFNLFRESDLQTCQKHVRSFPLLLLPLRRFSFFTFFPSHVPPESKGPQIRCVVRCDPSLPSIVTCFLFFSLAACPHPVGKGMKAEPLPLFPASFFSSPDLAMADKKRGQTVGRAPHSLPFLPVAPFLPFFF